MPGNSQQSEARRHTPGLFASIPKLALDLLFPPRCLGCDRVDWQWCPRCTADLARVPIQPKRAKIRSLQVVSTGVHDGFLMHAVQAMKYNDATHLAGPLGARISALLARTQWQPDIIIPVPMPSARLAKRGYNQAKLLAESVAQAHDVSLVVDGLIRTRETPTQVGLDRTQRIQNVRGAFAATRPLDGQHVLLIDDVFTTGATMAACAQAAAAAGAARITALTVTAAASTR